MKIRGSVTVDGITTKLTSNERKKIVKKLTICIEEPQERYALRSLRTPLENNENLIQIKATQIKPNETTKTPGTSASTYNLRKRKLEEPSTSPKKRRICTNVSKKLVVKFVLTMANMLEKGML